MLKKIKSKLYGKKSESQSTLGCGNYSEIDVIRQQHQTFNELRISNQFTDVILLSLDEIKFPAHKLILTSTSQYFKHQCKRAHSVKKQPPIIEVPFHSKYLRLIILYIYTGSIQLTNENVRELLEAAEILQMLDLQRIIIAFIKDKLNFENIFDMFRYSRKSTNEEFRNECNNFIRRHKNKFLEQYALSLSFDEILFIVNLKSSTCYPQSLCEHIVKWIKFDPMNRLHHLQVLLKDIDLTQLSIGYIDKLFADKILTHNQYFVQMAVDVFDRKLQQTTCVNDFNIEDEAADTMTTNNLQFQRNLFALTEDGIYKIDFENEEFKKLKNLKNLVDFRSTNFGGNGIVITGSSIRDDSVDLIGIRDCKYFCTATNDIEEFPEMIYERIGHQVKTLNNKMYVCGGMTNTVEMFDENHQKWIADKPMQYDRAYFEMVTNGNYNLYAFGGCLWDSSKQVEHYDVRTNKWQTVSNEFPSPDQYRAVCKNDVIYCFRLPWVHKFDLRMNKWLDFLKISSANVIFPPNEFDCFEFNDEISIMGQFYTFGSRALQFDETTNKLEKLDVQTTCCKNFNNFRFVSV